MSIVCPLFVHCFPLFVHCFINFLFVFFKRRRTNQDSEVGKNLIFFYVLTSSYHSKTISIPIIRPLPFQRNQIKMKMKMTTLITRIIGALSVIDFTDTQFTTAPKSNTNFMIFPRITVKKIEDLESIGVTIIGTSKYMWKINFTEMVYWFYKNHRQLFLLTVVKHRWRRKYKTCEKTRPLCFQWPEFTSEDKEMMKRYWKWINFNIATRKKRPMKKRKVATHEV